MEKIENSLRDLLNEREIIARCELLNRTYDFVRDAALSASEKEDLHKLVGKQLAAGIFANLLSGAPIFFNLPKLDTYTLLNGKIFHFIHTKKYGKQDFDNAYRKFQKSIPDLQVVLCKNLVGLLKDFMTNAGYELTEASSQRFRFEAHGAKADCFIRTSIRSLNLDDCRPEPEADCIILVPSSESLELFMQFFRENGLAVEDAGVQIWVANLEQGTIDPFIGYTTDMDIYRLFKNPRLAQMVRSTWDSQSRAEIGLSKQKGDK
jgi:hypothetical protein